MTRYAIAIFYSEEDECFVASAPQLPGCSVTARTREEALARVRKAIDRWLERARKEGRKIPDPVGGKGNIDDRSGPSRPRRQEARTEESGHYHDGEQDEEVPEWREQFEFLWVLAILFFGIGDIITTGWAVSNGAQEANPFLHDLVHGNFGGFILLKGLLLGAAYLYSTLVLADDNIDARFMPIVFILAGLFLMASNIMVTLGLIGALTEMIANGVLSFP